MGYYTNAQQGVDQREKGRRHESLNDDWSFLQVVVVKLG